METSKVWKSICLSLMYCEVFGSYSLAKIGLQNQGELIALLHNSGTYRSARQAAGRGLKRIEPGFIEN